MRRRLAPCLALGLASCVAVEGFDPVGDDAAINGSWAIDGMTPTTELCDALGASRVRATFLDDRRPVTHSGLFFQCRTGSFDTRAGSGAVIGDGRWTVRLDAIASSGDLVAAGVPTELTVGPDMYEPDAGTPLITVALANFFSATLSASFRLAGEDPSDERCAELGVATVALVVDDLGGGEVTGTSPEPCALGVVGTRALPGHTYSVRLRAYDAAGATVYETTPRAVDVATGADVRLDASGPVELGP